MQTILVPTDFSDNAKNAMAYAAQFARKVNASLLLLHAYMLPTPVSEVPYVMINAEEMQKENERFAREAVDKLQAEYGIRASSLVRLGFPSEEIEAVIEDQTIDLVIMGMKGKGALEKMMGSTTTSTIKKVEKPVLVIPQNATYRDIQHITYATDFSYEVDFHVYQPMIDLVQSFNAQLHIVHVQKHSEEMKAGEIAGEIQLDPAFSSVPHEFHIIKDSEVKHGIELYLEQNRTDMLVMITHEHGFLSRLFGRSHTKAMVYDTHVPLLVLKDK
ncbi:MAG TPA: universal stress protein [Chitinophagaceae bacterium]|nr:universal stress protein [Chitinophagaceae bacterium]